MNHEEHFVPGSYAEDPFANIQFNQKHFSSSDDEYYNENKSKFVDNIPDDSIVVYDYYNYKFENLYFHNNVFYYYDGIQYRKLHINEDKRNHSKYVCAKDEKNKLIQIYYSKFKQLYNLD